MSVDRLTDDLLSRLGGDGLNGVYKVYHIISRVIHQLVGLIIMSTPKNGGYLNSKKKWSASKSNLN